MAWDGTRSGTDPKYRTREHKQYRDGLVRQLKRDGQLTCTAHTCVMPTRAITNANGNEPDGLHAGHNDDGTAYDGPQHRSCNVSDGARRGRARQNNAPKLMPLTPGIIRPGG